MENKIWHTQDEHPIIDEILVFLTNTENRIEAHIGRYDRHGFYELTRTAQCGFGNIEKWAYVSDLVACPKALDVAIEYIHATRHSMPEFSKGALEHIESIMNGDE